MESFAEGERVDYISKDIPIVQNKHVFSFSIDAVLLGRFTQVPKTQGTIIDMCSGNGVIPLVLSTRSNVPITGIEIQSKLVEMARKSVRLNRLEEQIHMVEADVRNNELKEKIGEADLITCNPPYFATSGEQEWNRNAYIAAARHERNGTLEDIVKAASHLVKQKGKVSMVLRPERLPELLEVYRKYRIEPKRMKFIYPKKGKEANILLLEGIKDGKPGLMCLPPLTVYGQDGNYSEEFKTYYEGN